jgi:Flp pilus assembly pilin Flp
MQLVGRIFQLLQGEKGQTLVEYALIILLVSVALVLTLGSFSTALNTFYNAASDMIP